VGSGRVLRAKHFRERLRAAVVEEPEAVADAEEGRRVEQAVPVRLIDEAHVVRAARGVLGGPVAARAAGGPEHLRPPAGVSPQVLAGADRQRRLEGPQEGDQPLDVLGRRGPAHRHGVLE
jgi:hypothetical protein